MAFDEECFVTEIGRLRGALFAGRSTADDNQFANLIQAIQKLIMGKFSISRFPNIMRFNSNIGGRVPKRTLNAHRDILEKIIARDSAFSITKSGPVFSSGNLT